MTLRKDLSALAALQQWLMLSEDEQDAIVRDLEQLLKNEFSHQYTLSYSNKPSLRIPTFKHLVSGLEFNLIIGGQFNMGLSVQEEQALWQLASEDYEAQQWLRAGICASMQPVHTVRVRPFLMSRFPILDNFAREHIDSNPTYFISKSQVDYYEMALAELTREQIKMLTNKFNSRF